MSDADIVKQLLDSIHQCRALDRSALLLAAAQEIQRLRQDVAIAKAAAEHWQSEATWAKDSSR